MAPVQVEQGPEDAEEYKLYLVQVNGSRFGWVWYLTKED